MGKRVSSAAIGAFVIGSFALIVAAVVVLGSGRLFRKEHRFVCFFQGSLNGLKVGAPVKVRGVQIGSVTQILLRLPPSQGRPRKHPMFTALPVIIEIDESQLKRKGAEELKAAELDELIRRGLRAQLNTESFLTGLLYIDLDLHPDTPVELMLEPGTSQYTEIPTVPTDLAIVQQSATRALAKLEKTDFAALAQSLTDAATSARELMGSPEIKATLRSLQQTAANLNATVIAIRKAVDSLNTKTDPVLASLKQTSERTGRAMEQARSTMADLQMTFAPDSPLGYRLEVALENLAGASNAMRELADSLERNPSSIVRGKYVSDNKR